MAPRRSDYRTRKEYRWAKKVESREFIRNAPPIGAQACIFIMGFFGGTIIIGLILKTFASKEAAGLIAIAVALPATLWFMRTETGKDFARRWDASVERERAKQAGERTSPPVGHSAPLPVSVRESAPSMGNLSDELERLASLRQSGALTENEFQLAKAKLLSQNDPAHL